MSKNKLQKFSDLLSFPNVYENFDPQYPKLIVGMNQEATMPNGWAMDHFNNELPITVELACGRGEYCLGLAGRYPDKSFVGVDIKGARIWKGAKIALEKNFTNVVFLRTRIEQMRLFFKEQEISEIWITFPDPFLKKENRRLTSPQFLELFYPLLKDKGLIHLKTDSRELYDFTLKVVERDSNWSLLMHSDDIYHGDLVHPDLDIMTYYENMHLGAGKKITYISIEKN
jgi:tRNA (guanine-N7-)-methyltransferase